MNNVKFFGLSNGKEVLRWTDRVRGFGADTVSSVSDM